MDRWLLDLQQSDAVNYIYIAISASVFDVKTVTTLEIQKLENNIVSVIK